jgi:internalin A
MELQLWCEAEGCQHPVVEEGKGIYSIKEPREWVQKIAPYANFVLNVLKTVAQVAAPAINTFFGAKTTETWGIKDRLDLANGVIGKLPA